MSVGHELLINPSVILLDEPTSGESAGCWHMQLPKLELLEPWMCCTWPLLSITILTLSATFCTAALE